MGIVQKESTKQSIVYYIGAALGYFNKILLFTHFLSTDQVGLANVFNSISALFAQFALLGTPSISLRFFPFFQNKEKGHHGFFFWGNVVVMAGFLLSSLFLVLFKPLVLNHYSNSSSLFSEYYYYIIPLLFASTYYLFFDAYLRSLLKTVVSTVLNEVVLKLMISACITLYALKLVNFGQFVSLYVICNCLIPIILLAYIAYLKQLHIKPGKSPLVKRLSKSLITYGIYTILGTLGGGILLYVDTLMVSAKLGLGEAGIYSTIFLLSAFLSFPYRSITKIGHPIVSRFWRQKKMKEMADFYSKTTLVSMVIGGILMLLVWVNIDVIFSFLPKDYYAGKYAFLILCIGKYFDMVCGLNNVITLTSKRFKYDLYFVGVLIILTVIMNLVLIPIYGIAGASIATTMGLVIVNTFRIWFVSHYFKMQPFSKACFWILSITLAVWGITLLLPKFDNRYFGLLINSAVVSLLFMGTIILTRLSPDVNLLLYKYTKWKFLLPKEDTIISN